MGDKLSDQIIDGLVTAAAFHAGSMFLDGVGATDMSAMKRALVCGIADVAAVKVVPMLREHDLLPSDTTSSAFVKPLITGGLYVLGDKYVTKLDGRSTVTKVLHAGAASYIGAQVNGSVHDLINKQSS